MLADLRVPPGNRLEKLAGDRAGQYSIRINRQWRICFSWSDAGPEDVEVVDYHWEDSMVTDTIMPPVHPGEILLTEFLEPLGVSQYQLAKAVDVPVRRINEIVHGQCRRRARTAACVQLPGPLAVGRQIGPGVARLGVGQGLLVPIRIARSWEAEHRPLPGRGPLDDLEPV